MTFKTFASASLFALLSFGTLAAHAASAPMDDAAVMQYRYGDRCRMTRATPAAW